MIGRLGLLTLFFIAVPAKSVVRDGESSTYEPALAMHCGKATQHRDVTTGEWISGNRDCIDNKDKEEMLNYCKQVYPTLTITNVIEESETVHVSSWCHLGTQPPCRGHGHNIIPVRCVKGQYEPKALNVKEGCTFEHKVDYETCHTPHDWKITAGDYCHAKGKTLSEPQMLKPCKGNVDQWEGVQFLCCNAPNVSKPKPNKGKKVNPICLQPKKIGLCRALLPKWHFNAATFDCEFFHYGGCGGNDNNFETREECLSACKPGGGTFVEPSDDRSICGLPSDPGMCMAYFRRFYYDPVDSACKNFVYGGCQGNENNFALQEDCEAKCKGYKNPGTGPIQIEPPVEFPDAPGLGLGPVMLDENMKPVQDEETTTTTAVAPSTTVSAVFYTDETTIDSEHQVFTDRMDEMKVEHEGKVNALLAKYDNDNAHLSAEDKQHIDQLEQDLQQAITALEDEYDNKMSALNVFHMERMDNMVNEERSKTLQRFLDQLRADNPKVHHILNALEKYIAVERQDKSHTMEHYAMAMRDDFDKDSVPDLEIRIGDIDMRVNKTRTVLSNYPDIMRDIQDDVEEILATMPASPDFEYDEAEDDDEDDGLPEEEIIDIPDTTTIGIEIDGGGLPDTDICSLPKEVGPCKASMPSYYYNTDVGKCLIFEYGGCGGNENNFFTMDECKTACEDNLNEFDNVDLNGVLDGGVELPMEDEFDVGTDDSDGLDTMDYNSLQSSFVDDEGEPEDETKLDDELDKQFNYNGEPIFDVRLNDEGPQPLYANVQEASLASNWVVWVGLATGVLFIVVVVIIIAMRRNQTRPPMRIVVEKPEESSEAELSPEEKQLLALQQNGYENPTYKFFEKQMA